MAINAHRSPPAPPRAPEPHQATLVVVASANEIVRCVRLTLYAYTSFSHRSWRPSPTARSTSSYKRVKRRSHSVEDRNSTHTHNHSMQRWLTSQPSLLSHTYDEATYALDEAAQANASSNE